MQASVHKEQLKRKKIIGDLILSFDIFLFSFQAIFLSNY